VRRVGGIRKTERLFKDSLLTVCDCREVEEVQEDKNKMVERSCEEKKH